jgi:hypothetical protein
MLYLKKIEYFLYCEIHNVKILITKQLQYDDNNDFRRNKTISYL